MLVAAFKDQVSSDVFLEDVFFMLGTVAVLMAIVGLGFVDAGLMRTKNALDHWIQKIIAGACVAFGFVLAGYAVWVWQFNQAFGVKDAFWVSLKQWWLGGTFLTQFAQNIDPKVLPEADVLQVFFVFFVTFAMLIGAFLQSTGFERLKPLSLYLMSFVVGLLPWPFLSYLAWGSASPLTNRGLHDYTGVFNLYIFVGAWSVAMAWRLGPRIGAFGPDSRGDGPRPRDLSQVAIGVILLMFAIPFIVLSSGYMVPGLGYFGISLTTSGFGIALTNVFMAFIGGGLTGGLLAYRERNAVWALLGPLAGYIGGSALFDISTPWKTLLVGLFGPLFAYGLYHLLRRLRIDDPKIGPLTLGPGLYGAIVAGFVGWHVKTGGYLGLTGAFGFQHAQITPWWQIVGALVAAGFGAGSALVLSAVCARTVGLRVSEQVEVSGLDASYWPEDASLQPVAAAPPAFVETQPDPAAG